VKHLVLEINDERWRRYDECDQFPLVCDKLENLEVHCNGWRDIWLDFARINNLTKLKLLQIFDGYGGPSIDFLMKVAANWPNLTEITIQVDVLSSKEIARFIGACKHLQKLEACDHSGSGTNKYDELNSKLENEWKLMPITRADELNSKLKSEWKLMQKDVLKYSIIRKAF